MKYRRSYPAILAFFAVIGILAGCGKGGGGGTSPELTRGTVTALYPSNGSSWNDYVKNDGTDSFTATDTACDAAAGTVCLHGGEMRAVVATNKTSCSGLTASDSLGAFDWACDGSTTPVRMVSTGLKDGKNLSDLLDFDTPGWKLNSVTVSAGGTAYLATDPAVWWSNPVAVDNDGGSLATAGTIYIVNNNATGEYVINAPRVGLVGKPGVIISHGTGTYAVSADGMDFLWVEGGMDATGYEAGVFLVQVRFSALRNVSVENADSGLIPAGVYLFSSSHNALTGITAGKSTYGVVLDTSSYNTLKAIRAANNSSLGIYLFSSSYNGLTGLRAANNAYSGIWLEESANNTISGVAAANNFIGVYLLRSPDNTLTGFTVSNNDYGLILDYASNNTLAQVSVLNNIGLGFAVGYASNNTFSGLAASNNGTGVYLISASATTFSGLAASNNAVYGVQLNSSSDNYFTGPFKVGNNGTNCYVENGTNPGLDDDNVTADVSTDTVHDGLCIAEGASDFGIATTNMSLASSFVAKVTVDDAGNSSDSGGTAAITSITDWVNFENPFRGWGHDGSAFPNTDNQGQCVIGDCRIWDWSLLSGGTVIRDALAVPTGNNTLIHAWSGTPATNDNTGCNGMVQGSVWNGASSLCQTSFLRNAVEVGDDGLGNDNTLCESGETCLYMPNIASYQGHGNLVSAGTITTGGALENITLLKYETNGR